MVVSHHYLNYKQLSARVLRLSTDLAKNYSVDLQELFIPRLCSHVDNYFFQSCVPVRTIYTISGVRTCVQKPKTRIAEIDFQSQSLFTVFVCAVNTKLQ